MPTYTRPNLPTLNPPKVAIVAPCFNEQEVTQETIDLLIKNMDRNINNNIIHKDSFLYFVNDGSGDNTWKIIKRYCKKKIIKALNLIMNYKYEIQQNQPCNVNNLI